VQLRKVVGLDGGHPPVELVATQVQHHVSEGAHVLAEVRQRRTRCGQGVELVVFVIVEAGWVAQEPAGGLPDGRWQPWRCG